MVKLGRHTGLRCLGPFGLPGSSPGSNILIFAYLALMVRASVSYAEGC